MKYLLITYLLICAAYLRGFYLSYPKEWRHSVDIFFTFMLCVIGFIPTFVIENSNKINMKNLLLILLILFACSASAQDEKIKVQLKHSIQASGMYAMQRDTSGASLNGEITYYIGGLDFQAGITLRSDDGWKNIAAGITTTTRVFNINDNIKISGVLGFGALIVNEANPKIHPAYAEIGISWAYKLSDGWYAGSYFKQWYFTTRSTPVIGASITHPFN